MVWPISTPTVEVAGFKSRKDLLRTALEHARQKTLWLLDQVPEEFLKVRVHNFYSPIGWHFGHVGRTEEYWVSHKAVGRDVVDSHLSFLFADLPENPKDNRVNLPSREEIKQFLEETRARTLADLERADFSVENPFLDDGYAWDFALQHECQHQETICEMLQLIQKKRDFRESMRCFGNGIPTWDWAVAPETEYVSVFGGAFRMGTDAVCVYDNEKRSHEVEVAPFKLGKTQVTANQWLDFMRDGGYERRELWSEDGWRWREQEDATCPEYWVSDGEGYRYIGAFGVRLMDPQEAVSSISWFEAEAFAKWCGKRLPTEEEWEYAAACDGSSAARPFPWGDEEPNSHLANFAIENWQPVAVGSRGGATALGIEDMGGNVWEWTSSKFLPYPGFEAFPYDGYSKDHMKGEHHVCRGGSWATAAPILRCTFRNWYVPSYRQGFLGLRLAAS